MAESSSQVDLVTVLTADLDAEYEELNEIVLTMDDPDWDRSTPAPGWRIREQIAHLAFVDARAALAIRDPAQFELEKALDHASPTAFTTRSLGWADGLAPADLLARWAEARASFLEAARSSPAGKRVPWYGPEMAVPTKVTARLMETWAHGQDVADALGVTRRPTSRLLHVASIGVRTRAFSFRNRRLDAPGEDVHVTLRGPSGEAWEWGDPASTDVVRGEAEDFCLVVTQRRHIDDVGLEVHGPIAQEWMSIAQAFAGSPGEGRLAGQFVRPTRE